jgi:hydrogenase expression/formation protein HypE
VHGTVNDLAVCGATPRWISLALILEEGLSFDLLGRVLDAVRDAAADCGVQVVTGDTKVVGRGQCDGLYANTAGLGELLPGFDLAAARVTPGDRVLVSGPIGDHGLAVMAARHHLGGAGGPRSDSAPVHRLVRALQPFAPAVRFLRDPTRGGLAAVLNELAGDAAVEIALREQDVPVAPPTRALAELLGMDPLHAASEGRVLAVCAPDAADAALAAWRARPEGSGAACCGEVRAAARGRVVLNTLTGGCRLVDIPRGELLPRIC